MTFSNYFTKINKTQDELIHTHKVRSIIKLSSDCTLFTYGLFSLQRETANSIGLFTRNKKSQLSLTTPCDAVKIRPSGSWVTQGHSKWHHSIACIWFSYYSPIVTLCLKCTVFEIWLHIGHKSPKKPTPLSFGAFFWGWPLANFSTNHTLPESEIMGLSDSVHFAILLSLC